MSQRILFICVLLLGTMSSMFAQQAKPGGEARQMAMGGSSLGTGIVVNPFISEDPSLLLINPAFQTKYANYAWWNVGGGTVNGTTTGDNGYGKQNVGVSFGSGKDLSFGAVFCHDPSYGSQLISSGPIGFVSLGSLLSSFIPAGESRGMGVFGAQSTRPIANVWELIGAYQAGGMSLGFAFSYGSSNLDSTVSSGTTSMERQTTARMLGFRAGLLMDLGAGSNFSAHGAIRLDHAADNVTISPKVTTQGGEYSASGTEIEVGARLKMKVNNRFSFTPNATFVTVSAEPTQDSPRMDIAKVTYSQTASVMGLSVGAGGEYKTPNFLIAGGLSYQMLKVKQESSATGSSSTFTQTYTSIPTINLGAEWVLLEWLTARAGYVRMLGSLDVKNEFTSGSTSSSSEGTRSLPISYSNFGGISSSTYDGVVTLGLGLRFGAFSLDATVSDEALRRGLGLIGGGQDNINTFGYITTSYNFE